MSPLWGNLSVGCVKNELFTPVVCHKGEVSLLYQAHLDSDTTTTPKQGVYPRGKMKRATTLALCFLLLGLWNTSLAQTTVTFVVKGVPENVAENVGIRGDKEPLSWQTSIPLDTTGDSSSVTLEFPGTVGAIEFKFVLFNSDDEPTWETNQNRRLKLASGREITSTSQWDIEQLVEISALPKLQPEQLMEDYKWIETMVLEVHPGTYRYNDRTIVQQALDDLKKTFQSPLTHGEAYLAMSKVTALLQCDHTQVGFNNQNATINSVIHRQSDKLPFTFKWIDEKMIVIYDATEAQRLERGTEIQRINDIPVSRIQTSMMPYIAADGATDKSRLAKMEIDGFDFRYNAFDVFYPLLFPVTDETVVLDIKPYDGEESERITVKTLTRGERNTILVDRYSDFPRSRDDLWHFEITEDNIGILTLNSFGLMGWKRMTIDYKQFLADAFERLATEDVQHLIIDIRKNNGGSDEMKDELFTYFDFDRAKLKTRIREGRTRYLDFPERLKPYVQTWGDNPWYFNLKPDRIDEENGYYIFDEHYTIFEVSPAKETAFKGDLYLLTSPTNASLAFYLANEFKALDLGRVVGQETGGNRRDINGGQILFLRLPQSEIEIDFPVMGAFTIKEEPNQGVVPDLAVKVSLDDVYNSVDTELEAVLAMIKE